MSLKHLILTSAAAMAIGLCGAPMAQTPANVSNDTAGQHPNLTADEYKHMKVDEATAADEKFHANRTEANMQARDKAEAEAAAAAGMPEPEGGR
jgi:hypothetical protein